LSDNRLGNEGYIRLIKAIKNCDFLVSLDISKNEIQEEAIENS